MGQYLSCLGTGTVVSQAELTFSLLVPVDSALVYPRRSEADAE